MSRFFAFYLPTVVFFLAVDAIWLYTMGEAFFKPRLAHLMRDDIDLKVAALFYVLFCAALVVFAIAPAAGGGGWTRAMLLGAFLGLTAYGAYDLTNLATLKGYTWTVALMDMAWGTVLGGASAVVGYVAGTWWLGR